MNNDFREGAKAVLKIVIVFFVFCICVAALYFNFKNLKDQTKAEFWNKLFLTVFSSLFSALIAYIVSISQIKRDKKNIENKELKNDKRRKKLIQIECQDNFEALKHLRKNGFSEKSITIFPTQLSFYMYDKYIDKIDLENSDKLLTLIKYRKKTETYKILSKIEMEKGYVNIEKSFNDVINCLD